MSKEIFTFGWEIDTKNQQSHDDFIRSHRISKEDFDSYIKNETYLKLTYQNDILKEIITYENGKSRSEQQIKYGFFKKKIKYEKADVNIIKSYEISNNKSNSFLGGMPTNKAFQFPSSVNIEVPFQHIAELECEEPVFKNGARKINLVYPILAGIELLFLDYSNPLSPIIFNDSKKLVIEYFYDKVDRSQQLIFDKSYLEKKETVENLVTADMINGIPKWIQAPTFPISPVTNKTMKFLCQIPSNEKVKTVVNSISTPFDYFEENNSFMNIGDGDIFVFHEIESNLVCLFTQIT